MSAGSPASDLQVGVVAGAEADEDSGGRAGQLVRSDAGVLERLPGDLQEQALLRIEAVGLAGRDPEEPGIEAVDRPIDEAALVGVDLARRVRVGVVERRAVPPVGRHDPDRVGAGAQQLPVGRERIGPAGQAAAGTDDRDRLMSRALGALQPLLHVLERAKGAPQSVRGGLRQALVERSVTRPSTSTTSEPHPCASGSRFRSLRRPERRPLCLGPTSGSDVVTARGG